MTDLNELETLAKAATPGPWRYSEHVDFPHEPGFEVYLPPEGGGEYGSTGNIGWAEPLNNAEFIAAANPAAVLGLVKRVREAEARIAAVRALHHKYSYYEHEDVCENTSDKHMEERHRQSDEVGEFYCADLWVSDHCDACWNEYGERVAWPCPTIQALDGGNDAELLNDEYSA